MEKSINERVLDVINFYENGSQTKFCEKNGLKNATINGVIGKRKSDPNTELLYAIIKNYPVNPYWLILGEGEMEFTQLNNANVKNTQTTLYQQLAEERELKFKYMEQLLIAKDKINHLSEKINELEKENTILKNKAG